MSQRPYYSNNNEEDSPELKSPMPWIGIYVSAASLAICLAMAADTFNGFRSKKVWFPSKFSALNAASLTILAIAMKMPLDLSTSMPTSTDQLAKLSGTALMSIAMSKCMPSLGAMDDAELFTSITALGVLVITVAGNVCIELGTGLIRLLIVEHALLVFLMLACFVILSSSALIVPSTKKYLDSEYSQISSALIVPSTKKYLDLEYSKKLRRSKKTGKFTVEELRKNVRMHWMMAVTADPQFVIARAVTCSASEAICFLVALILAEAELRLFLRFPSHGFMGNSDYKWSTIFILLIQSVGVGVGTIAPVVKWYAMKFQRSNSRFKTENYWIEKLEEWKKGPLPLRIRGPKFRKLVRGTKNTILCFCIKVQILIVFVSKLVWHIFFCSVSQFFCCCQRCKTISTPDASNNPKGTNSKPSTPGASNNPTGIKSIRNRKTSRDYVLYLEAEEEIPERILKNIDHALDGFIGMGKKNEPKNLMELLQEHTKEEKRIEFDSNKVPALISQEPRDCWAMPVVTLTSIAIAISKSRAQMDRRDKLVRSVSEGLLYVKRVENSTDSDGKVVNIRNAAYAVWSGVELDGRWLGEDLRKIAQKATSSREKLQDLAAVAKKKVKESEPAKNEGSNQEDPPNWTDEVIAANSMYRISETLLRRLRKKKKKNLRNDGSDGQADEKLFKKLSVLIARILSACFTNLPHAITTECFSSPIEKRERSVRHAAQLLGETKKILEVLEGERPYPNPDECAYIDGWRSTITQKSPLVFPTTSK